MTHFTLHPNLTAQAQEENSKPKEIFHPVPRRNSYGFVWLPNTKCLQQRNTNEEPVELDMKDATSRRLPLSWVSLPVSPFEGSSQVLTLTKRESSPCSSISLCRLLWELFTGKCLLLFWSYLPDMEWGASYTFRPIAAVAICTRPAQVEGNQHSIMDGRLHRTPPLPHML